MLTWRQIGAPMTLEPEKNYKLYSVKGHRLLGSLLPLLVNPLKFMVDASRSNADIVRFRILWQEMAMVTHPDHVRYMLVTNHKNFRKDDSYIRFQSVGGLGLITSHGEKWKRDRQKIQPMFNRDVVTGYHFEVASEVSEKYKRHWLEKAESGSFEMDIGYEMALITAEVIMRTVFGRGISDETVRGLHAAFDVIVDYLKRVRLIPSVDMRKRFRLPSYFRFRRALDYLHNVIQDLGQDYRDGKNDDQRCMFAMLLAAQKQDPEHFNDIEIRDQCVTMLFAGFETTAVSMQWMWYALDGKNDLRAKLREEIARCAPCTATTNSSALTFAELSKMDYLTAFFRETIRLYPPFWSTGRTPIEDDMLGDFKVKKGMTIVLPQFVMHRHAKWWDKPEELLPERFLPLAEADYDEGIYFPFSHGPRKCIGAAFAEMEAKTIMAKLLPLFDVACLNKTGNPITPSISLKLKYPLRVRITRAA